jgi:hypothetical protein
LPARFGAAWPRLLEPIGNITPAEAEERYYASLDEPASAARSASTMRAPGL